MSGRRERTGTHAAAPVRPRRALVAGITMLALAGTTAVIGLAAGAGPAGAAPTPNYTAGKDTATLTTLGVRDKNCLVSAGGSEVWIKPGDKIDFESDAAGLTLLGLNISTGKVLGYNATATIGSGNSKQTVKVAGGKTTTFPSSSQSGLGKGDYALAWTIDSVAVAPLLGGQLNLPLSSSQLKSGASLSWNGVIHVTSDAPKCKLGVSTPKVGASVGPIKVTVPQQNINVPGVTLPNKLPSLGSLVPKAPTAPTKAASKAPTTAPKADPYKMPGITVPEQVVPGGTNDIFTNSGGSSGDFNTGAIPLGTAATAKAASADKGGTTDPGTTTKAGNAGNTVELAADAAKPSSQLPVILAVLAVIALTLVAGTYAKLFLLKKPTS